jgi:hypothetical protein
VNILGGIELDRLVGVDGLDGFGRSVCTGCVGCDGFAPALRLTGQHIDYSNTLGNTA